MLLSHRESLQLQYYNYILKLLADSGIAGIYLLATALIFSINKLSFLSSSNGKLVVLLIFNLVIVFSFYFVNNLIDIIFGNIQRFATRLTELNENLEIHLAEQANKLQQQDSDYRQNLERFADIGILSAGMIHDINSPLATVQANLELMDDNDKHLIRMRKSLSKITAIVESTRAHIQGEITANKFKPLAVVQSIIKHNPQIKLHNRLDTVVSLKGSVVGFDRIITNLVHNACEAALVDGSVLVELSRNANLLKIAISNTGKPLAPGALGQLLLPQTSKAQHTGIGLIVTRRLAQDYFRGELTAVTPKVGFDTTIELTIPLALQAN